MKLRICGFVGRKVGEVEVSLLSLRFLDDQEKILNDMN